MKSNHQGVIGKVLKKKRCGYIKPELGSPDVFFHFSVVDKKDRRFLKRNVRVKYKCNSKKNKALKIWLPQETDISRRDIRIVTIKEETCKEDQKNKVQENTSYKYRLQKEIKGIMLESYLKEKEVYQCNINTKLPRLVRKKFQYVYFNR